MPKMKSIITNLEDALELQEQLEGSFNEEQYDPHYGYAKEDKRLFRRVDKTRLPSKKFGYQTAKQIKRRYKSSLLQD
jgi:hypothetical protein